jgi:hypothetical protein
MKISKILYILALLILFSGFNSCSSEKEVAQRRNLMMPQKDELPRNSRYSGIKKKRTQKPKKRKNHRRNGYSMNTYYFPVTLDKKITA